MQQDRELRMESAALENATVRLSRRAPAWIAVLLLCGLVLATRARIGSIPGTSITNIAPSRRFYAGGGGSVRGFGYQLIGPRNTAGDPSGGRSLTEFSLEARVKTGIFGGALSIVPVHPPVLVYVPVELASTLPRLPSVVAHRRRSGVPVVESNV